MLNLCKFFHNLLTLCWKSNNNSLMWVPWWILWWLVAEWDSMSIMLYMWCFQITIPILVYIFLIYKIEFNNLNYLILIFNKHFSKLLSEFQFLTKYKFFRNKVFDHHILCLTCQNAANNCTSCITNRALSSTTCPCQGSDM